MPWSSCDEREAEAWGACRISLVQGSWIGVARLQRPAVRATPLTPPPGLCSQNAPARTGTGTRHWGGGCSAPSERTAALGVPRDGSREVLEWVSEGLLPPSLLLVGVEQPGARAQDGGFCSRPPSDSPILANFGGVGTVGPGQSAWVLILGASQGAAVTVPPPRHRPFTPGSPGLWVTARLCAHHGDPQKDPLSHSTAHGVPTRGQLRAEWHLRGKVAGVLLTECPTPKRCLRPSPWGPGLVAQMQDEGAGVLCWSQVPASPRQAGRVAPGSPTCHPVGAAGGVQCPAMARGPSGLRAHPGRFGLVL